MRRASCAALLAVLLLVRAAGAADPTAVPTQAATPTAVAPIPLADVAAKSDELAVYLSQVEDRWRPGPDIQAIVNDLPAVSAQVHDRAAATHRLLSGSPTLRDVDNLSEKWRLLRNQLDGWSDTLTQMASALDREMSGLDELRAIWRATGDQARVEKAPPAVLDRIEASLGGIAAARKAGEQRRQRLLELQDQVVAQAAATRDPVRDLGNVRRQSFGRLLVADRGPVWATYPPEGLGPAFSAAVGATREEVGLAREYIAQQLPRALIQLAMFVLLAILLRRARGRVAQWALEDDSLARGARVFEVPASAAAVVTLLATGWFLPDVPLLLADLVALAALLPNLRVLRRLVDPPAVPALWAIGIFYAVDQLTRFLSSQPFLEQLLFTLERLGAIAFLIWFIRSGRFRAMWARDSRWAPIVERAAHTLVLLITFSTVAGALGFMQLSRYLQEAMVDSAYAALVLYGGLQVLEALWAYVLRSRLARRLHMVTRHRALMQRRGEVLLGWLTGLAWVAVTLRNARLLEPLGTALRGALGAQATIGSLTLSLGAVLAFGITVWLSFAISRFVRFILAEDVYSRVQLAPGMPYALSTLTHYAVLLIGFLMALAATGMQLDRFALLAGAFGVGIGFGLQTIVNNFVSGLILLFERPIKVGDLIQVGGFSGEVRHIGIRSSTVRTFEGADVILPNGELVSAAVTNWTFTDRMRRIDIPVGVAYGTDPDQVLALLRGVAVNHPLVLEQPAPLALFTGFGDSALTFELRCWTDTIDKMAATRSELSVKINAGLKEAGIEIPFPQRDMRLIGAPLAVRLVRDDDAGK
ncbi:MAG TPA: mechanosensitive ion channel domain-containing protein [Candidatus Dormibacteraeota bacterium]|nr:mechanosensitive ion channel domain-containing protein [Candidatus Dormibacteraeota bacterium]